MTYLSMGNTTYVGCGPLPGNIHNRMCTCLVGDPYQPLCNPIYLPLMGRRGLP